MRIFKEYKEARQFGREGKIVRIDLHLSEDRFFELERLKPLVQCPEEYAVIDTLSQFLGALPGNTLENILHKNQRFNLAILNAHGSNKGGEWTYQDFIDGQFLYSPINSWIAEQSASENYGALILFCCNESRIKPAFRGIPIIYAEGLVGLTAPHKVKVLEQ